MLAYFVRSSWARVAAIATFGSIVGCSGGSGGDECTPGAEGCPCAANLCLTGLQCLSNVCVLVPGDSAAAAPDGPTSDAGDPTTTDDATSTPPDTTMPQCPDDYVDCGGACADLSGDPAHCGDCANACTGGEVCQDGECLTVDNCTPNSCPGLSYCDTLSKTCVPGCSLSAQCAEHETCDLDTHACICSSGYHAPEGICVACDTYLACGNTCALCPQVDAGVPTCVDGKCGVECGTGYVECGGACHPDFPPICDQTGGACEPCDVPETGTVVCKGQPSKCEIQCPPSKAACDGDCKTKLGVLCFENDDCCSEICKMDFQLNYKTCQQF